MAKFWYRFAGSREGRIQRVNEKLILLKSLKSRNLPNLFLHNGALNCVTEYRPKYSGVLIFAKMPDSCDMQRHVRFLYNKSNMLLNKFRTCSVDVKLQLFRSYRYKLYCDHL